MNTLANTPTPEPDTSLEVRLEILRLQVAELIAKVRDLDGRQYALHAMYTAGRDDERRTPTPRPAAGRTGGRGTASRGNLRALPGGEQ